MSITISSTKFEVTESEFTTLKRYFRKAASGNTYTITAGETLIMAATPARINTGQPWLPFEFYNGVISRTFESTNVSGYGDSYSVATPSPTLHEVTI